MASRWRTWNKDYALDILSDPQQLNEVAERTYLAFGRGKININLAECCLPTVDRIEAPKSLSSTPTILTPQGKYRGLGRGRGVRSRFIEAPGPLSKHLPVPLNALFENSSKEWPELRKSAPKAKEAPSQQAQRQPKHDNERKDLTQNTVDQGEASTLKDYSEPTEADFAINPRQLTADFLKELHEKERMIILDGVPENMDAKKELKEMINESGKIESFEQFQCGKVLIRMENELNCEWIISWLDGSQVTDASDTISVLRVCDVINDEQPNDIGMHLYIYERPSNTSGIL